MLMRDAIHRSYIPSMEALLETLRGEVQTSQANTENTATMAEIQPNSWGW